MAKNARKKTSKKRARKRKAPLYLGKGELTILASDEAEFVTFGIPTMRVQFIIRDVTMELIEE